MLALGLLLALVGQTACESTLRRVGIHRKPPATPTVPATPTPTPAPVPATGTVGGRVFLTPPDSQPVAEADPHHVVIYLDRLDGKERSPTTPHVATIRHTKGPLWPEPMVVALGQPIRFVNQDEVYHRVFSSSETNRFDLGVIKSGESRDHALGSPGIVRVYCSLHPWESGNIFVAPSIRFHTMEPPGRYKIVDVPPGRYRVATWSEALPSTSKVITVKPGQAVSLELPVARGGGPP
jgi:plastocyanin